MQITNLLAALATNTDLAQRETTLTQLREQYAKLDSAGRDSDVGRAATIILQAEEIAKLKAAAQAAATPAPAPTTAAITIPAPTPTVASITIPAPTTPAPGGTVMYHGNQITPATGGTVIRDNEGIRAIAFRNRQEAISRFVPLVADREDLAADPAAAFLAYQGRAESVVDRLMSEGAVLVPQSQWTWSWYHTAAAVLGTVILGGVAYYAIQEYRKDS